MKPFEIEKILDERDAGMFAPGVNNINVAAIGLGSCAACGAMLPHGDNMALRRHWEFHLEVAVMFERVMFSGTP